MTNAREEVLAAMAARPNDPWPRGEGHVVLALPGSEERAKAYHEPGGSFSPEVGSFGLSLWITDAQGNILRTSDSIDLAAIHQGLICRDERDVTGIRTETDAYRADWEAAPMPGDWRLQVTPTLPPGQRLMLVVRSVGPAGGEIETLRWVEGRVFVNGRWIVRPEPQPLSVYVGPEGLPGWTTARSAAPECRGHDGWCHARLELSATQTTTVEVLGFRRPSLTVPSFKTARAELDIGMPDARFADSLHAQVAHLMMATVRNETRPGEPWAYPLAWLRDGAYQVAALARAGRLDIAQHLARYFAENDFFGGFGAEADAPGLAIWAMEEVASRLEGGSFDGFLWPHVKRRAKQIIGLLAATQPVTRVSSGPLVPEHRARPEIYEIARPAQNGLITGRMDHHHPILYVNAVNYRGLLLAAGFADRNDAPDDARAWRAAAASIKQAWNRALKVEENERTFICGLYPTWIASPSRALFEQGLDQQWQQRWRDGEGFVPRPLWTYFYFAFAHQYLFLGRPERTWQTIRWFWDHQPSPGLYTWWESDKEENSFHQWEHIRGWVKPTHVTPHYWAAAEMLLLQLDMLAYVDESADEPVLVIGGGIPAEWCDKPMSVRGLLTSVGRVDWEWDGKRMKVTTAATCAVRLGPAFPEGAAVQNSGS